MESIKNKISGFECEFFKLQNRSGQNPQSMEGDIKKR